MAIKTVIANISSCLTCQVRFGLLPRCFKVPPADLSLESGTGMASGIPTLKRFTCALPSLQTVLLATTSLSLLGRLGSNIYSDRLLEYINKIQQGTKRSSNAASFARAVDLKQLLRIMLHVRHAYENAEKGGSESDAPITLSQLRQARIIQDYLVTTLGCDLTVHNPNNPHWHTGNAVPLHNSSDYRQRTPWVYYQRVQQGTSAGKFRAHAEMWSKFALRFALNHFFRF